MPNTGHSKIQRNEDLMETISHGSEDYPFQFYEETMSMFDFQTIDWHWHSELEFVFVEKGEVRVSIGTDALTVKQGQGLFINSKELHYFISEEDAVIPNFLFPATFVSPEGSRIYKKFSEPIIGSGSPWLLLDPSIDRHSEMLFCMKNIIALQRSEHPDEMKTFATVCRLWSLLSENISLSAASPASKKDAVSKARLQLMMQFIQDSYASGISLEDIAAHASVSKSTALNLFRKYLHTSPVDYLISYRLNRAASLLAKTEEKVGNISLKTGFANVDYFCRTFKKHYHMTPSQYRQKPFSSV